MSAGLNARLVLLIGALDLICAPDGAQAAKTLTQYTRTVRTQEQAFPQDTIRAISIVQTADGDLWLYTNEGLAILDGADFGVPNKTTAACPATQSRRSPLRTWGPGFGEFCKFLRKRLPHPSGRECAALSAKQNKRASRQRDQAECGWLGHGGD